MNESILCEAVRAFPDTPLPETEEFYRSVLRTWADIYRGEPPWAYTKKSGLYGRGSRRVAGLNCAKVLCDSFAAVTFGSQPDILCSDPKAQAYVMDALQENGFWEKMPGFLSRAYALGGGVIKVFLDGGRVCTDYVDPQDFIPTGCGRGGVNEGIFGSVITRGGNTYRLLERHAAADDCVVVDRALFSVKGGVMGRQIPLETVFGELPAHCEIYTGGRPLFAYFRPGGDYENSMMGKGVFSDCTDTLKAIDIAFDSFSREFILGRKRIIVPSSCIRTVVDPETGNVSRYFDTDDEVYQALKCDEERDLKISDNTCELRVSEHVDAINALLDILCFQTGLSAGTLSFTSSTGVRTAAEIKSMESRTELTMQANRAIAVELIENTVRCIIRCGQLCGVLDGGDVSVRVAFSDRKTVDRSEVIERNIRLLQAGLISRVHAVMAALDCSEEDALDEINQIDNEKGKVLF